MARVTPPNQYLKQCWLLFSEVWYWPESNFVVSAQGTIMYNMFENHTFESIATIPRTSEFHVFFLVQDGGVGEGVCGSGGLFQM